MFIFLWYIEEKRRGCLCLEIVSLGLGYLIIFGFFERWEFNMFVYLKIVYGILFEVFVLWYIFV